MHAVWLSCSAGSASQQIDNSPSWRHDMGFALAGKPGEVVTDKLKMTTDEQSVVTKRLLLAGVGVAAISAFALIPTTTFNGTASKPVFYYLVPVIRSVVCSSPPFMCAMTVLPGAALPSAAAAERNGTCCVTSHVGLACLNCSGQSVKHLSTWLASAALQLAALLIQIRNQCYHIDLCCVQDLLDDEAKEIEGGEFSSVPVVVRSILKKPNEARKNMYTAIDYLEGSKQQPARELVGASCCRPSVAGIA